MAVECTEGEAMALLQTLRFLADEQGKVTVSQRKLAEAIGWDGPGWVRNAAKELERRGLVRIYRKARRGDRRSNTFEMLTIGHEVAEAEQERTAA